MNAREARRNAFLGRQQKSKQTSEGGGLGFFKSNLEGGKFWKCEEGDHDLDIVPYLAGSNDPDVKEGEWTYVLEVYEHRDVGNVEGQSFICLSKTYKLPCPICEHRQQLIKEGADDETIKALRPSRYPRSIYNVVVYDSDVEEDKGVQIWHTSHFLMEMHLIKLAESTRRDIAAGHPPYKYFADPDEGYSVRFTRSGQNYNTRYLAHQLVQRNYQVSQDLLDQAHQLDAMIHIPTYDEVKAAFWGDDATEGAIEEVAPPPRKQRTSQRSADAAARGVAKTTTRGAAKTTTRGAAKTTTRGRRVAPSEENQTQQYAPEDELPASLQSASDTNEIVCPGGGEFGANAYELDHCEKCELWEECCAENQRLLAEDGMGTSSEQEVLKPEGSESAALTREAAKPTSGRRGSNGRSATKAKGRRREAPEKTEATKEKVASEGRRRTARGADAPSRGAGRGRGRGLVR